MTLEQTIKADLNALHPAKQIAIKNAYYAAMENLQALANELETADLDICEDPAEERSTLLELHIDVCRGIEELKPVDILGKLL